MAQVTDLDVVVPDTKQVKLGGVLYDVPADLPMEIFLRLNKEAEKENQSEQLEGLLEVIGDLFAWDATPEASQIIKDNVRGVLVRRSVGEVMTTVQTIYKADDEAAEEAAQANPTTAQVQSDAGSNGTKSSSTLPSQTTSPTVIRAADLVAAGSSD